MPAAPEQSDRTRTVILGAAGRDFHNFNMLYRDDPTTEVVAFTAAQIPHIAGRRYPPSLAGALYKDGIPIVEEAELETVCAREAVQRVLFAYSDVEHATVMHLASRALAAGADFVLAGPRRTMLESRRTVIAVSAVRTGCGKSQIARWLSQRLRDHGLTTAALRHPMPYGDLAKQAVQRFARLADLAAADCTIEEREEYEPHIAAGNIVYAGVDYAAILAAAEQEAEVILWDGGNNDFPFIRPDLHIVVVDALRPDQLTTHHPGEAVLRMADIVVINKVDTAPPENVAQAERGVRAIAPSAPIVHAASPVRLSDPASVKGRRVLVIEDGPTITHGGMPYGAGYVAAKAAGASEIVDPRPFATPPIREAFARFPHIGPVLPALGYGASDIAALQETIDRADVDIVVAATPTDLANLIATNKQLVRAYYKYAECGRPALSERVEEFIKQR